MTQQHLATITPFPGVVHPFVAHTFEPDSAEEREPARGPRADTRPTVKPRRAPKWAFLPFIAVAAIHVAALTAGIAVIAEPTKLLLMPALAFAVLAGAAGVRASAPVVLLLVALLCSWLGDGAAVFAPFLPTLPTMLLCFGIAHLAYVLLFWRHIAVRRVAAWSAAYGLWWVAMVVIVAPLAGELAAAVAVYGFVLAATAVLATRCIRAVALGGAFFLASDTLLAFEVFLPGAMPAWTDTLVMATYCIAQGLIAAGVLATLRSRRRRLR